MQFFKEIEREKLEILLGWFEIEIFAKNDILYDIDDEADSVFILVKGKIQRQSKMEVGE